MQYNIQNVLDHLQNLTNSSWVHNLPIAQISQKSTHHFLIVLLRFQKFCCRFVSVGFCKKNSGFRFGFGFCLSRFPHVVNVVRLCGLLHIKPAAVHYIFLCITPVDSSKYPTACDWWRENHHLYPPPPVPNVAHVAKR